MLAAIASTLPELLQLSYPWPTEAAFNPPYDAFLLFISCDSHHVVLHDNGFVPESSDWRTAFWPKDSPGEMPFPCAFCSPFCRMQRFCG